MEIVGGLDLHRQQITFELVDRDSGEVRRGRLWQPDRPRLRRWLSEEVGVRAQARPVRLAMEGCTGWRFVAEEIAACGFEALVAEPAEVQARRGPKRRAKTDRADARLLRELLERDELPLSWVPPLVVLEWRERIRLYKTLLDQRTAWTQRLHAELFQHGVAVPEAAVTAAETRTALLEGTTVDVDGGSPPTVGGRLSDDRRHQRRDGSVADRADRLRQASAGVSGVDVRSLRGRPLDLAGNLVRARRLPSVLSLRSGGASFRVGLSVYSSDDKRTGGHLTRQRAPTLRWAIYEAGKSTARAGSPDRDYYRQVKTVSGKRATCLRPQDPAPLLPHAAQPRPRRRLPRPDGALNQRPRRPARTAHHRHGLPRPAPASECARHHHGVDGPETSTRSRTHHGDIPSIMLSPTTTGVASPRTQVTLSAPTPDRPDPIAANASSQPIIARHFRVNLRPRFLRALHLTPTSRRTNSPQEALTTTVER